MYLRFIGSEVDLRTGKQKGIYTLAYELLRNNKLLPYEEDQLKALLKYFEQTLPVPSKFSKNRNNSHKENISTSWFKDSATDFIKNIYALKQILETHDIIIEVLKSKKPGYIIYEDRYQIVVDPF